MDTTIILRWENWAEKKKQSALGYTVTLPVESAGTHEATHWFLSEFKLPEPRFPTSYL